MLPEYSYTEFESLAQISTSTAEIQNFFLEDYFLLAHPVDDSVGISQDLWQQKTSHWAPLFACSYALTEY